MNSPLSRKCEGKVMLAVFRVKDSEVSVIYFYALMWVVPRENQNSRPYFGMRVFLLLQKKSKYYFQ